MTTRDFSTNGSYTFRFHDTLGQTGEAVAIVDWILGVPPEWEYVGTGTIQTFVVPADGEYILQARGAQGGNGANGTYPGGAGGNGGYASGKVSLLSGEVLTFVVGTRGQHGSPRTSLGICPGGAGGFGAGGGAGGARCGSSSSAGG